MNLSRGNIFAWRKESKENQADPFLNVGVRIMCPKGCKLTRLQCLKKRKMYVPEDKALMNSLEQRYDSWQQGHKEGTVYLRGKYFNILEFGNTGHKGVDNEG